MGRQLAALMVFAALLGGGIWWLVASETKITEIKDKLETAAGNDESDLFYDAIGRASTASLPTPDTTVAAANYTLEVRVAKSREEAETLIDALQEKGIEAYYTPLSRAGKVVYRVRRGIFASEREAQRAALALKQTHKVPSRIVKLQ
jgi:hypothetical protein